MSLLHALPGLVLVALSGLIFVAAAARAHRRLHTAPGRPTPPAAPDGGPLAAWLADPRFRVYVAQGREPWVLAPPGDGPRPDRWAVAYADGELVALHPPHTRPPPGTEPARLSGLPTPPAPSAAELAAGAATLAVAFGPSPFGPGFHRVTLRNVGAEPVRVRWFGAFRDTRAGPSLHTVTGQPFSAAQFRSWYAVADPEGWLAPGEAVGDPVGYGGDLWVWAFAAASGREGVVGARRAASASTGGGAPSSPAAPG